MRRLALGAAALLLLVAACSDDGGSASSTTNPPTTAAPTDSTPDVTTARDVGEGDLGKIAIDTQEVAEVHEAIALAARPSSPNLYIAGQDGRIRIIKVTKSESSDRITYQLQNTPLLDLSDEVIDNGERGLLGAAFSSDGRKLYVDFTAKPDGRTVVLEYELGDRTTVDKSSRRQILTVEQPYPNHNGGNLVLGPDGYLYVGLGDGGSAGDPHGNGQDPHQLLGKILRIDPEGATGDRAYGIPAGNPFPGGKLAEPEMWLRGVRNPWRFSFDRATGDLWVGDVGQGDWEEIDRLPSVGGFDAGKGANLGWSVMEASHPFKGDKNPAGATLPVFEYGHGDGACAVVGGFVYRGAAVPGLAGAYVYADNCRSGLDLLRVDGTGKVLGHRHLDLPLNGITSLGEDRDGELYVMASGKVIKLVEPGGGDGDDG